ncbi:unnamed protein product [Closterium sp. NIES-54]
MNFEHVRDAALCHPDVAAHLLALINTALAGNLTKEAAQLLTTSKLLAFTKPEGGTRPIAVGEVIHRVIAKAALLIAAPFARRHFTPIQFGVATPGGAEAIIHTTRTYLKENGSHLALQLDISNAFNAVERGAVFEGLRDSPLSFLIPFTHCSYGAPSELTIDAAFNASNLQSTRDEQLRTWRQASLPPTLGGPGITDPAVERFSSCLASTAAAAHLLSATSTPSHPQVALLLPLFSADNTSGSPLPQRLAAAELTLPTEALREGGDLTKLQHKLSLHVHAGRAAVQLQESRGLELNPLIGHTQRLQSLIGPGAGDWLMSLPLTTPHRLPSHHFTSMAAFRLGMMQLVPGVCNCNKKVRILDPRLPNHLLRCGTGKGRTGTHHTLRDECERIATEAGFAVQKETTLYSPVEGLKADLAIRHPDSGAVWLIDVTMTDPISSQDPTASRGVGWAARVAARGEEHKYRNRRQWVGFIAMAVETYGCCSPGVMEFMRLCANLAAKRLHNAEPTSREAVKLFHSYRQRWSIALPLLPPEVVDCSSTPTARGGRLLFHSYRQRWSIALQRGQANALCAKTLAAFEAEAPTSAFQEEPLDTGDLLHMLEQDFELP